MKWIPYAMVRVTAFFIAGVWVGIYYPDSLLENLAIAIFLVLTLVYAGSFLRWRDKKSIQIISGLIGLLAIFFAGYVNLLFKTESRQPGHLRHQPGFISFYQATINSGVEERARSWRVEVEVNAIQLEDGWKEAFGKVLIYISKDAGPVKFNYGDQILIKGSPLEIPSPGNPHEFDFKRFLNFKNVYHQQFVRDDDVRLISSADRKGFLYYSQLARTWASDCLKTFIKGQQEQAIALALVLGVTDGLDNELQNAYAASGAMHVLAVSGLHVGIIYWMILVLLKPVRGFSWSPWPIAVVSLLCLWAYAFVTGLSPSVLRAVTMFSFMAVAKPFSRSTNIYNTLAASAFILLIYNPYLIMSVGFQLSYLAVLGIVYLQRPLYRLWEPQSRIWDWCWSLTCISIAAQIATFALGLLYFHQFPVYFLFSNLFVIPGSFVVLVAGIALMATSFITPVASLIGWLLEWSIKILNAGVFLVEDLPFSLISGVYFSTLQCWLLMGMAVAVILLFEYRKFHWLIVAFFFCMVFAVVQWRHYSEEVDQKRFMVYRVNGHGAVEWIDRGNSYFFTDSLFVHDDERIRFHILPNRIGNGVKKVVVNDMSFAKSFIGFRYLFFEEVTVLWIDHRKPLLPNSVSADYLVISNNSIRSLSEIIDKIDFKWIILDSSNSGKYAERIDKEAKAMNLPVHSVLTQGAFMAVLTK